MTCGPIMRLATLLAYLFTSNSDEMPFWSVSLDNFNADVLPPNDSLDDDTGYWDTGYVD